MDGAAVLRWASPAATNKAMTAELGLIVLAAALVVGLLLIRARREHDLKIRKAASVGYFDPDAARYGHSSATPGLTQEPADTADRSLAPTFVAPTRAKTRKQGASAPPAPRPVPSAFGSFSSEPPGPVPAFDPVAAMGARPAASAGASAGVGPAASPPPPPPTATHRRRPRHRHPPNRGRPHRDRRPCRRWSSPHRPEGGPGVPAPAVADTADPVRRGLGRPVRGVRSGRRGGRLGDPPAAGVWDRGSGDRSRWTMPRRPSSAPTGR